MRRPSTGAVDVEQLNWVLPVETSFALRSAS